MTMTRTMTGPSFMLAALLLIAACGQAPPDEGDVIVEEGSYYPLVDGAQWTYVVTTLAGQVIKMEIVDATSTSFAGQSAWLLSDNPDADGEWTQSTIVRQGSVALRVHKQVMDASGPISIVDYDPGFVRADDAWDEVGFMQEVLYERTETDGAGQNPSVEARGHSYEILALDVPVTVPAGTFSCIEVERVRTVGGAAGERVLFWYAAGVGKVREERPTEDRVEELASVSIPGGASYP